MVVLKVYEVYPNFRYLEMHVYHNSSYCSQKVGFFFFELFAHSEQKKFLKYYLLVFHETNNDNDPFENVDFNKYI